jgi:hypothetical protein
MVELGYTQAVLWVGVDTWVLVVYRMAIMLRLIRAREKIQQ